MENLFKQNLSYLKDKNNETYASIGLKAGVSANTVTNWIDKNNEPKISQLEKIAQYFDISVNDLMYSDLRDVHLNIEKRNGKNAKNVHLNVHPSVHLNAQNDHKKLYDQVMNLPQMELNEPDIEFVRQQNLLETLSTAVRALERANAQQERIIAKLEEENSRLKSEIPEIGKPVKANKARAS